MKNSGIKNMYKSLLIGCGNIGALYDLETEEILTHAKAYFQHPDFEFSIHDSNLSLLKRISEKYSVESVIKIEDEDFSKYDCISICTPTPTHFHFLERAIESNVKVIICEKPIASDDLEINKLISLYKEKKTKILVNYIRRFQKPFRELRESIQAILTLEKLTNISIRYQKGFLNNCSHAFDLIQFLLNKELDLKNVNKTNLVFDHFEYDPTLCLTGLWNETNINVLGLSNVKFPFFEIEFFFENQRIGISNSGQNIDFYSNRQSGKNYSPLVRLEESKKECLKNYMKPIIDYAHTILSDLTLEDNFMSSATLNKKMLEYLKR